MQAAKQHSCPFCRLANKATIHRPCSYGWEAVIVLLDDFIQSRPGSSVIVRILDVFLPGLRPLQHLTSRHGWTYLRTPVSFTWEKLPNREVNMYWSRWPRTCPRIQAVKHMETTGQSCWIKQCEFIDVLATNTKTTLMNGWTWQLLRSKRIFWATQVRSQDLLSRINRQFWLLYMPNLKNQIILRKPQTVLLCSLVKLRQTDLVALHAMLEKKRWALPVSYMVINSRSLAIKLPGIAPLACFHFGRCFYNEIRSRAFFGGAHLQSTDAMSLCFHCIDLLVGGQLEDLLSDHGHVGTLIVCGNISHQQMHFVICHVELCVCSSWQKASTEKGLGFFAATAMTLVCCIMNTSSPPVPDFLMVGSSSSARTSTLMYPGKMGASCNFTPKPEKSKSSYGRAMGYTIPTALWYNRNKTSSQLYISSIQLAIKQPFSRSCWAPASLRRAPRSCKSWTKQLRLIRCSCCSAKDNMQEWAASWRCELWVTECCTTRSDRAADDVLSPFTHRPFYTPTLLHTCEFWVLHISVNSTDTFTHLPFYTQTLWHTYDFTHIRFYTQTLWCKDAFTHRDFYTQKLLHTDTFTHRHFDTQKLLHTEHFDKQRLLYTKAFTHRALLHTDALTQRTLSQTETFTHKSFYTQNNFTHRRFDTQKLLHTKTFTHKSFYTQNTFTHIRFNTQTLLHTYALTHRSFWRSDLISCAKVRRTLCTSQFYLSVWRSNLISCEKVAPGREKSQFYVSFWSRVISCERVATGSRKSQFYVNFWRSSLVSCEKVAFRAVSLALPRDFKREIEKKERARGQERIWRCEDVKRWRWEDTKMRRCEDEKMWRWEDEQMWRWEDVKMSSCEDEKMWRWEDVKMRRCEDEQLWRWEDVKMRRYEDVQMWRWEDVKMWGCEDEKMWRWTDVKMSRWWENVKMMRRCEDEKMVRCYVKMWKCENVWQTPAIRRTLRSDALGKNWNFKSVAILIAAMTVIPLTIIAVTSMSVTIIAVTIIAVTIIAVATIAVTNVTVTHIAVTNIAVTSKAP